MKIRSRRTALVVFAVLAALHALPGCTPRASAPVRPEVLVSVPPQAWLVRRIAGDAVDVEVMVPPGADPHTYEPTIKQMRAASRAALYVKVGHPNFAFERVWFERFTAENPSLQVVDGTKGVTRLSGDPHLWVAPAAMHTMAIHVASALAKIDPSHATDYSANLVRVESEIDSVDRDIRATLAPFAGRSFFVFHPAWGYFAEAYGLVQVAIEHEGKSPTADELARVVARAKAQHVRVIFVQPQTTEQSAVVVAEEIGGQVVPLDPLAYDWADNMRHVAQTLREVFEHE
jgi:zinc transport system substrate-binding protein